MPSAPWQDKSGRRGSSRSRVSVVVASAVGVVQLYLDLNDWLAGCGSRIALKLQFQAARKVHVRHYVVVTRRKGKERGRSSIVGGGTRCIFVGFWRSILAAAAASARVVAALAGPAQLSRN